MSDDKIELIESNLDSIQAGITTLNTLMKSDDGIHGKKSILKTLKALVDSFDGCLARMGNTYNKYHQEIVESGTQMVNSLNQEYQTILNYIKSIETELNKYKKNTEVISKPIDKYLKRNHKEPRLYFNDSNTTYEFDVELMKKYSGSYIWELYEKPSLWTDNGDIYINHSGENYESILKYMKNDGTLIEELKEIDSKRRNKFVKDLEYLRLPVKSEYMNELCFDDDKMKMEAWKEKVIKVNEKDVLNLNMYLKKNGLFDSLFNMNTIEQIKYDKENNVIYINMNLKYGDFIEDYCKQGEINKELIKNEGNGNSFDEFENELKTFGMEFDETKKHETLKCFCIFMNISSIIKNETYDIQLQEWLGFQHKWKLIFRASKNGYSASSFHGYCDNKGPTLIIIESDEGCIFGGYTTKSWRNECNNTSWGSQLKRDPNSFIFTLKNPHNVPPKKLNARNHNNIHCIPSFGPVFYDGYGENTDDICIHDNCNNKNSCWIYNDGCHAYECDSQYRMSLFVNRTGSNSRNYFTVKDYEVYTIDN